MTRSLDRTHRVSRLARECLPKFVRSRRALPFDEPQRPAKRHSKLLASRDGKAHVFPVGPSARFPFVIAGFAIDVGTSPTHVITSRIPARVKAM